MSAAFAMLEREIGPRAAAKVIEIAGGERLAVPSRFNSAIRLRERFGDELAALLIERLGDSRFYVPRVAWGCKQIDDAAVASLDAENRSATQIARALGCSVRGIHKARARNRASSYVMGRTL